MPKDRAGTSPQPGLPQCCRVYRNHHLDSTRWEVFEPRPDDVIVTTSYKSGTTWTQQILNWMLHGDEDPLPAVQQISPWLDARFMGQTKEALAKQLEEIPGRRFVKSHLPLDGLPYYPECRYVIVARDPRDVFMSLLNHYANYSDIAYAAFNGGERVGDPLPPCPQEPRSLWRDWITRGWFEWESEGWPFWSNLHHTQSYWDYRHLPNFLFLHYSDMLADPAAAVRSLSTFLGIELSREQVERVVEETRFATVRKQAEELDAAMPEDAPKFFAGGMRSFFYKGTNGRWRDVLTEDDLELLEQAKARVLTPDCAAWLETGGEVPRD